MLEVIEGAGEKVTIDICLLYYEIGFYSVWNDGKDLTLIDKEKDLPSGNLERSR